MASQFENNLCTLFGTLGRPVVSPFCEGEANLAREIRKAPEDAVLFLDVPRSDYPISTACAVAEVSGRPFVIGNATNTAAVRKSMRSLGLSLFQVSGSEGTKGHIFGTPAPLGDPPAIIAVADDPGAPVRDGKELETPDKVTIRKSDLFVSDIKDDEPDEKRIVTGVAMAANEVDADGEFFSPDTVHDAMVTFMLWYRNIGLEHAVDISEDVDIVESWQLREDTEFAGNMVKAGSWMMSLKVWNHRLWQALKNGTLAGFSVGGEAFEVSAEMEEVPAS
jgi:hypothetical protein